MEIDTNKFHNGIELAFQNLDKKRQGISCDEITDYVASFLVIPSEQKEDLRKKIIGYLNRISQKSDSKIEKVRVSKKHKGKYTYSVKRGYYRLKAEKKEKSRVCLSGEQPVSNEQLDLWEQGESKSEKKKRKKIAPNNIPTPILKADDGDVGTAGEFAVMSELVFRGYNPSRMAKDDGVDTIAYKDGSVFFIQVKTSLAEKSTTCKYEIKKSSFDRWNRSDMFYIFVFRFMDEYQTPTNWYAIIASNIIQRYIEKGIITGFDTYTVTLRNVGKRLFICGGGDEEDITKTHLNRFDNIKK